MGDDFAGYRPAQGDGYDALGYNELIAVLWKAVTELNTRLTAGGL